MTREDELKAIQALTDANVALGKKNQALRADMARLEAENAELREKSMTYFERLKEANTVEAAATMIYNGLLPRSQSIGRDSILKWLLSRKSE